MKPRENGHLDACLSQGERLLHVGHTQPVGTGIHRRARARDHAVSVGVGLDHNHEVLNTNQGLEVAHVTT